MFVVDDKWQVDKDLSELRPLLMPCQVLLLQRIFGVMPSKLEPFYFIPGEGYVEGVDVNDKSLYSVTPKVKKLLEGWIAFLSAYS